MNYKITGTIIFPIFCFLTTLFALIADPYFTYAILDSLGKQESIQPTKQLFLATFGFGEIPSQFIADERSHLEDVLLLLRIGLVLLFILAILFAYLYRKTGFVKNGFYFLIILLLLLAIMPFQQIFTLFHLILFPQGNWTFPADSVIIQTYPFEFFYYYAISIAIYAIFLAIMLYRSKFIKNSLSPNYISNHAKI